MFVVLNCWCPRVLKRPKHQGANNNAVFGTRIRIWKVVCSTLPASDGIQMHNAVLSDLVGRCDSTRQSNWYEDRNLSKLMCGVCCYWCGFNDFVYLHTLSSLSNVPCLGRLYIISTCLEDQLIWRGISCNHIRALSSIRWSRIWRTEPLSVLWCLESSGSSCDCTLEGTNWTALG
jgi:hypothetical protein